MWYIVSVAFWGYPGCPDADGYRKFECLTQGSIRADNEDSLIMSSRRKAHVPTPTAFAPCSVCAIAHAIAASQTPL